MYLKPTVTVVSIFYNREKFVKESVMSLLNQTYENLNIILVDDNSSDNTYELLKNLCTGVSNVVVVKNEFNKGFTKTLLDTISPINDKYIAIHGSGDISLPTRFEKQVAFLEMHENVGVVGSYYSVKDLSTYKEYIVNNKRTDDILNHICVTHGEVMFRNDLYKAVGGYRPFFHLSQDRDLWLRMSFLCELDFVPEILYQTFIQPDGVSGDINKRLIQLFYGDFAKQIYINRKKSGIDILDKYGEPAWVFRQKSKSLSKDLIRLAVRALKVNKRTEAVLAISLSMRENSDLYTIIWATLIRSLSKFQYGPNLLISITKVKNNIKELIYKS